MSDFIETYQPILYTLLGALIALESGFIHHRYQSTLQRKDEDRKRLLEINSTLLDYHASLSSRDDLEKINLLDKLSKATLQLRDHGLFKLSNKLTNFALDKSYRSEKNLFILTNEVQLKINPKLVSKYKPIDDDFEI